MSSPEVEFCDGKRSKTMKISDLKISKEDLGILFERPVHSLSYEKPTEGGTKTSVILTRDDTFVLHPDVFKYDIKFFNKDTSVGPKLSDSNIETINKIRATYLGQMKMTELDSHGKKAPPSSKIKPLKRHPNEGKQESSVLQTVVRGNCGIKGSSVKTEKIDVSERQTGEEKTRQVTFMWMHRKSESGKFAVHPEGAEKLVSFNWSKDHSFFEVRKAGIKAFRNSRTQDIFDNAEIEYGRTQKDVLKNFDDYESKSLKEYVADMNKKYHRCKILIKTTLKLDYIDEVVATIKAEEQREDQNHKQIERVQEEVSENRSGDSIVRTSQEQNNNHSHNGVNLEKLEIDQILNRNESPQLSSQDIAKDSNYPLKDNDELNLHIKDPINLQDVVIILSEENVSPEKKRQLSPVKTFKIPPAPLKKIKLADASDMGFKSILEVSRSDFDLTDTLGSGSFGEVKKGLWRHTPVAIKTLDLTRNTPKAWRRESNNAHHMSHPNIVTLYAICEEPQKFHMIMEYVDGDNLASILFNTFIRSRDEWKNLETNSICHQTLRAVDYIHNHLLRFVHRDIKPGNLLLTRIGHIVKLCDLGLAKMRSVLMKDPYNTSRGKEIRPIGTPAYMAPEVYSGEKEVDEFSEMWAVGITILEICMNNEKHVWDLDEDDPDTDLKNIFEQRLIPDVSYAPDFLRESLQKCFAYVASDRISAAELLKCFASSNGLNVLH